MNTKFFDECFLDIELENTWNQSIRSVKNLLENMALKLSSLGIKDVTRDVIARRYQGVSIRTHIEKVKEDLDRISKMLDNLDEADPMTKEDEKRREKAVTEHIQRGRKIKNPKR